jgi:hypothetical protein
MEVDAVRVVAGVQQGNADAVAFRCTYGGAWDAAIVCPGGELNAGDYFHHLVLRHEGVFAEQLAAGEEGRFSGVEVGEDVCGVKPVLYVIHFAGDGGHHRLAIVVPQV